MIVFHYLKRRLRLWQLVAVAVPIAILTFGLLNFYRFVVVGRVAGSPTSVGDITSRISAASDFLIRSDKVNSHQSSTLDQLINRSTGVDALALIIKYTHAESEPVCLRSGPLAYPPFVDTKTALEK